MTVLSEIERIPSSLSSLPAGSGTFPTFVSVSLIDSTAVVIVVLILLLLAFKNLNRKNLSTSRLLGLGRKELGIGKMLRVFWSELIDRVLLQRDIISDKVRRFAHLCMFWGFVGLTATTTADYIFNEQGNYIPLVSGSLSWIRLLGNASGIVMMLGASITIARLIGVRKFRERVTFSDAWFSILLFLAGATGFLTEYFGEIAHSQSPNAPPAAAYSISTKASILIVIPYSAHLILIALLFTSAPVSAFMHVLRVPSLRYLDRVGNILAKRKETSSEETLEKQTLPNMHRSVKEDIMISEIKAHYEKPDQTNRTEEKDLD